MTKLNPIHLFKHSPPSLAGHLIDLGKRFSEVLGEEDEFAELLTDGFLAQLEMVWSSSDFVAEQMIRSPRRILTRLRPEALDSRCSIESYRSLLKAKLDQACDIKQLGSCLRHFRQQEMVRIIWRDFSGMASVIDTTAELSALAEVCVNESLQLIYQWEVARWGRPIGNESGRAQQLVVIGMGKLGAGELNLSSDIDLIFCYAESGSTDGKRSKPNQEFFVRLGQQLIKVLDEVTAEGFVFRVDMRLRPYGQSGALALNFNAMESYYSNQGREWERYAMVKARVMGGDYQAGNTLLAELNPFIYRRYVDFGAFESLREMKKMITREVKRRQAQQNIKTGAGGIREVEFIVQSFQLIRGGKDRQLQNPSLWAVLQILQEQSYLPASVVGELREAYVFLRNCEHRLQGLRDQQTQTLPDDPLEQLRLARGMGFEHWIQFSEALAAHRESVSFHFARVVCAEEEADEEANARVSDDLRSLWLGELEQNESLDVLRRYGYQEVDCSELLRDLVSLRSSRAVASLQVIGRDRLDRLIPQLIETVGDNKQSIEIIKRLLPLLGAILRRSAYIALLVENPHALQRLVALVEASPWIASELEKQPLLLDELIDSRTLFRLPEINRLQDELRQLLLRIPEDDLEQQMECLRHFKQAYVFRVAASEVVGKLPVMEVSDYLTIIAEVVMAEVLNIAWQNLVAKHGYPSNVQGRAKQADFCIIAYGKLGGLELGYSSDLDLVFLYDAITGGSTDGDKPVDNSVFYTRLGQRFIHIMTAVTHSGTLYEVDARLRPSGASGLLVSSVDAFTRYQKEQAWTWEHQALVRARAVGGSEALTRQFLQIRREILMIARPWQALRKEVVGMREKMAEHLISEKTGLFHLKQDAGGIVDIEFMVQYQVLRWAAEFPALSDYTDNMRILEKLVELKLMDAADAQILREAYLDYRSTAHVSALQNLPSQVSDGRFNRQQLAVVKIWQKIMRATYSDSSA